MFEMGRATLGISPCLLERWERPKVQDLQCWAQESHQSQGSGPFSPVKPLKVEALAPPKTCMTRLTIMWVTALWQLPQTIRS